MLLNTDTQKENSYDVYFYIYDRGGKWIKLYINKYVVINAENIAAMKGKQLYINKDLKLQFTNIYIDLLNIENLTDEGIVIKNYDNKKKDAFGKDRESYTSIILNSNENEDEKFSFYSGEWAEDDDIDSKNQGNHNNLIKFLPENFKKLRCILFDKDSSEKFVKNKPQIFSKNILIIKNETTKLINIYFYRVINNNYRFYKSEDNTVENLESIVFKDDFNIDVSKGCVTWWGDNFYLILQNQQNNIKLCNINKPKREKYIENVRYTIFNKTNIDNRLNKNDQVLTYDDLVKPIKKT
jgi:hypothetical protein